MKTVLAALLTALALPTAASVGARTAPPGSTQATVQATVTIRVRGGPQLTFNRLVTSTVTLTTPFGRETGLLLGAAPYAPDPGNYWAGLKPLRLRLALPAGTQAGRYPVTASTSLYVCDQTRHLCSVRPAQVAGALEVGSGPATLALILPVPPLRKF